jgi:cytochrome c oxidase accessory protein FixG
MTVPSPTPASNPAPVAAPIAAQVKGPGSALATINDDGSRRWLKPRPTAGKFWRRRRAVAAGLIALFTLLPHIVINAKPAVLLDLTTRRFTFFGVTFLPNDTLLLALLLVSTFLSIFFITALLGRVWCGWACPQTVYLEFVYRPIERFFEGSPGRADRGGFKGSAFARLLKFVTFLVVSCLLAHTFLAYFVGVEQLAVWVRRSPFEHPASFLVMAGVVTAMMFDFTYFREQTCLVACPYGRFQSALLDRYSLIVGYDRLRGEPRGKAKPGTDIALSVLPSAQGIGTSAARGDCVDCGMCVTTCPTGIDIRNGLQMECVHCTQCIDACDAVMTKLSRPTGLIRYASQAELNKEQGAAVFKFRPRLAVYPIVVTILLSITAAVLFFRGPLSASIVRTRGGTFSQLPDGVITNPVGIKVINRRDVGAEYHLVATARSTKAPSHLHFPEEADHFTLGPGEAKIINTVVESDTSSFVNGSMPITISIVNAKGEIVASNAFSLLGPMQHFDSHERERPEGHTGEDSHSSHEEEHK